MSDEHDWSQGQLGLVWEGFGDGRPIHVREITRVTARQVVTGGARYRRSDGLRVSGGGGAPRWIVPLSAEQAARYVAGERVGLLIYQLHGQARDRLDYLIRYGDVTPEALDEAVEALQLALELLGGEGG